MSPEVGTTSVLVWISCGSVRFFWIRFGSDSRSARKIPGLDLETDFTVCAQRTSLPVRPFQRISRVGGAQRILLVWFAVTRSKVREQCGFRAAVVHASAVADFSDHCSELRGRHSGCIFKRGQQDNLKKEECQRKTKRAAAKLRSCKRALGFPMLLIFSNT